MSITWRELSAILDSPIAFHRIFATVGGSACAGLFLSQAYYWTKVQDRTNPEADGWFYKTQAEWHFETALTRREQETARRDLKSRGLIEEDRRGMPAKLYFRIDRKALLAAINEAVHLDSFEAVETTPPVCTKAPTKNGGKRQTGMAESAKQDRANRPHKDGGTRQALIGTENTPETTQTFQTVDKSKEQTNGKSRYAPLVYEIVLARQSSEYRQAIRLDKRGAEKYLEDYHAPELIAAAEELASNSKTT